MKKIMVCCGSSMITSTMAINKLKQAMQDAGIDAKFIQCKFAEVQGKVKEERPDVIVPTGVFQLLSGHVLLQGLEKRLQSIKF